MATARSNMTGILCQPPNVARDQARHSRLEIAHSDRRARRLELGQFPTSPSIAKFMAGLSQPAGADIHLLDPGAGVGSLGAAWVEKMLRRDVDRPRSIRIAFENHLRLKRLIELSHRSFVG